MATIVLQAAGSFLGGFLGSAGSALGSAAGAMAGYMIDRSLLEGARRLEGPRLGTTRPFMAEEGAPVARVYGTARVSGNLIWATRFEESQSTSRQGSKGGGPKVTTYSYFCNAAFALCEGEIAGVRRIWADGREIDLEEATVRIYRGTEAQVVDPLIAAKQGSGNAPAYRGIAYAVFDRFPLAAYGNRIPQFQFEVMRPVSRLNDQIRSVALLPGSTEYGLLPRAVTRVPGPGETVQINRNVLHGPSDLVASLDELQALCPNLEEVAVIVTWFGNDLSANACKVRPMVAHGDTQGYSEGWSVAQVQRGSAAVVSRVNGTPAFGGTPSDRSVIECIAEIRGRGLRVALYPFLMMDVPRGNMLLDPYGGIGQPAYPWRGRITCFPAPGQPESPDRTAAARSQVDAFCGVAMPSHFHAGGSGVSYSGPGSDWGYRRMILHYAHLAVVAGGVDTFLLGSEMRGLTTLRDGADEFPFVEALCQLAGQARTILGADAAITYGADWSEYFGHQPADGSGDVYFHLDPLWSHPAITAVGIDNYMPLSDWRDAHYSGGNPDGFKEPYDRAGLRSQVRRGEGFDWYYASQSARAAGIRSPITDGAHGKPWVFRYKDIRSWWGNRHYNRAGGVELDDPTSWQPRSKPIWFTELGCPAIDKGPNQPNAFPDPKSSEDALPYFSSGGRSDTAQARFLQAHLDHWNPAGPFHEDSSNPVSAAYGGRMVDFSRICLWAWDARPFPAFPMMTDEWADGGNWHRGHWLNGRLSGVQGSDLVAAILEDHGLAGADTSGVGGCVSGYVIEAPTTARAALEPYAALHGVAIHDENGTLVFRDEAAGGVLPVEIGEMVVEEAGAVLERTRVPEHELPRAAELAYVDPFQNYQAAMARSADPALPDGKDQTLGFPGCMDSGSASALLADWVSRRRAAREQISFAVPASSVDVAAGSLISLPNAAAGNEYLVTQVELGLTRRVSARRIARAAPTPSRPGETIRSRWRPSIAGAPHVLMLDLPMMSGGTATEDQFRLAAFANPWRGQAAYNSPEASGFSHASNVSTAATIGELIHPLSIGPAGRIDRSNSVTVALYHGALSSVSNAQFLNGANAAAIRADNGEWEIVQFRSAEEISPSTWRLSELLRGQHGTEDAVDAGASPGAAFVLLNDAVVRAGLASEQTGLPVNWRIGPAGQDFGSSSFAQMTEIGGVRARLPLAPVHLRLDRSPNGDARVRWKRRGRVGADSWLADDIPLGEENERYRVEVATAGGAPRRTVEVKEPGWTYGAAQIAADFPDLPVAITLTVSQISATAGAGLSRSGHFFLAA